MIEALSFVNVESKEFSTATLGRQFPRTQSFDAIFFLLILPRPVAARDKFGRRQLVVKKRRCVVGTDNRLTRDPLNIGVLARSNLETTMVDLPVVSEIVLRGVVSFGNKGFGGTRGGGDSCTKEIVKEEKILSVVVPFEQRGCFSLSTWLTFDKECRDNV